MPGDWRVVVGRVGALRVYETPSGSYGAGPVLFLCHELPRDPGGGAAAARAYPALADRLAEECSCRVVAGMLRGTGGSDGEFSAGGWLDDIVTICDEQSAVPRPLWLVGFGLGAAVALRATVRDQRIRGVASIAGPADLAGWIANRDKVLDRCRRSGVIKSGTFPEEPGAWAAELVALAPLDAAAHLGGRPLLVVHGSDDDEVPAAAARALADAAVGSPVDLRVVPAAGHWLRADPRVVATLVGWLERQSS
ncbi:MAG: alpha/beta hydrolase family protein [Acidimicrobiales bacterium]